MKKFLLLVSMLVCTVSQIYSQSSGSFNYQAVIRDNNGELIQNQQIGARITIIESTANGSEIYRETHDVITSEYGMVSLLVGNGSSDLGTFTSIDWGSDAKFIKVEINIGNGFVEAGTFQLFSVPYANYALEVENNDDADADPSNEIQDISLTGTELSITNGSTVDLISIQDGVDDNDNDPSNEIQDLNLSDDVLIITNNPGATEIDLSAYTGNNTDEQELTLVGDTLKITNGNQVILPYDSSNWVIDGDKMYYNGGNVGIGSSAPVSNLEVKANVVGTVALFQVINANNDTVFAVYPDGVKIFIDSEAKGRVGGFAVSGRNPAKSTEEDILIVTSDSTRVYINEDAGSKGRVGGFAVSGRNPAKGNINDYFNISGDVSVDIINPSEARILWYPNKEAFLVGRVLVESPDSVGTNSFATGYESKAIGDYSQALGFHARSFGSNSIAIGNYANTVGANSFAVGDSAQATGLGSYAIGSLSRDSVGNPTNDPTLASGDNAIALGIGAQATGMGAMALGASNTASGNWSVAVGRESTASGEYTIALGRESEATESYGIAIGYATKSLFPYGSTAIGYQCEATNSQTLAVGRDCISSGAYSAALGRSATASNSYSIAINGTASGWGSCAIQGTASGLKAVAVGYLSEASSDNSIAIGNQAISSFTGSIAIGNSSDANAVYATAIGEQANAEVFASTAIGAEANAPLQFATAIGNSADATGGFSLAIGANTSATGYYSVCINGEGNEAHDSYETVIGRYAVVGTGDQANWVETDNLFVVGNGTGSSARSNALTIYKNGNVKFDGNLYPDSDGGNDLGISSNRWNTVYATNGTINTSDLRLKSNISLLSYGLIDIMKLRPVMFNWKGKEDESKKIGLIAQEVDEVISEVVHHGNDKNGTLGINYSDLVPVLIQGVQEQQAIISSQQAEIEELKQENLEFKRKLEELAKKIDNKY